jgi:hypothetical protein
MRLAFPSLFRLLALFLALTVMNAGMAMAAYVCPQLTAGQPQVRLMDNAPCIGMDLEKPVQCAEFKAGAKGTPDYLAAAPTLAPISFAFIIPTFQPLVPAVIDAPWAASAPADGSDPPYLQTLRLRI